MDGWWAGLNLQTKRQDNRDDPPSCYWSRVRRNGIRMRIMIEMQILWCSTGFSLKQKPLMWSVWYSPTCEWFLEVIGYSF